MAPADRAEVGNAPFRGDTTYGGVSRTKGPERRGSGCPKVTRIAFRWDATTNKGLRTMKRTAFLLVLALGLGLGLSYPARSAVNKARTSVRRVVLLGSPNRPIFRVTGRHLRVPPRRPSGSPSHRRLCQLRIRGNAGHDYGSRFYVVVSGRHGKRLYGAGRYHPKSNELDCIGLIVLSHSSRHITFTFGSAYTQFPYPRLRKGDRLKVVVDSKTHRIAARFRR
jgi:hypothetical protein